jgi:GTP-binding protein LepA
MNLEKIRNFSIIAHIDHGKSTLADRMLEITETVEKRKMEEQVLDNMELERERGITIKMTPARMEHQYQARNPKHEIPNKSQTINHNDLNKDNSLGFRDSDLGFADSTYTLNLIDTPGHIDFAYEVSRALKAVEGSILLVDATQGVQAQTLTTLEMAREMGLKIIPVLSKVDSINSRVDDVKIEVAELLEIDPEEILETSGKTGEGVKDLLDKIIEIIPAPTTKETNDKNFRSLVFDFQYSNHQGVIVYTRVFDGVLRASSKLRFKVANESFITNEIGIFSPEMKKKDSLSKGEIGYIVTGIKKPGIAKVGDTIVYDNNPVSELGGYKDPNPVVWASVFPEDADDFDFLRSALGRLQLSDSSFTFEEESSGNLGRGFRCGFLGMLHLEIVTERLRREFDLNLIVTLPTINYLVTGKNGIEEMIYSPILFPGHGDIVSVKEPWIDVNIIVPSEYIGNLMQVLYLHEAIVGDTVAIGDRQSVNFEMPLRELMRNFFDEVKSATSGYGSLSYELGEFKDAEVTKLEVLVAEEPVPAFTRIVSKIRVQEESEKTVEKLYKNLPRQMFTTKIQAKANGRILASKTLSALKKNVTAGMYGGDITRKMKLREKQKKGKKRMQKEGKVNISHEVFLKMMRG